MALPAMSAVWRCGAHGCAGRTVGALRYRRWRRHMGPGGCALDAALPVRAIADRAASDALLGSRHDAVGQQAM